VSDGRESDVSPGLDLNHTWLRPIPSGPNSDIAFPLLQPDSRTIQWSVYAQVYRWSDFCSDSGDLPESVDDGPDGGLARRRYGIACTIWVVR
jgi:hypothetical protein